MCNGTGSADNKSPEIGEFLEEFNNYSMNNHLSIVKSNRLKSKFTNKLFHKSIEVRSWIYNYLSNARFTGT